MGLDWGCIGLVYGVGQELDRSRVGVGQGLDRDWIGVGKDLGRIWVGIEQGIGQEFDWAWIGVGQELDMELDRHCKGFLGQELDIYYPPSHAPFIPRPQRSLIPTPYYLISWQFTVVVVYFALIKCEPGNTHSLRLWPSSFRETFIRLTRESLIRVFALNSNLHTCVLAPCVGIDCNITGQLLYA